MPQSTLERWEEIRIETGLSENTALRVGEAGIALCSELAEAAASLAQNTTLLQSQQQTIITLNNRMQAQEGRGGDLNAVDFGTATPSQQQIAQYACEQIWNGKAAGGSLAWNAGNPAAGIYTGAAGETHTLAEIWSATTVNNLFDGMEWRLTNTQNTIPAVWEWFAAGYGNVGIGGNGDSGVAGVAKGDGVNTVIDPTGKITLKDIAQMPDVAATVTEARQVLQQMQAIVSELITQGGIFMFAFALPADETFPFTVNIGGTFGTNTKTIQWGDNSAPQTFTTTPPSHAYTAAGSYIITVRDMQSDDQINVQSLQTYATNVQVSPQLDGGQFFNVNHTFDYNIAAGTTQITNLLNNAAISKYCTAIVMPDSVTDITGAAMPDCRNLTDIVFSANLQTINFINCFLNCYILKNVNFENFVNMNVNRIFSNLNSIEELNFQSLINYYITNLDYNISFTNCYIVKKILFPKLININLIGNSTYFNESFTNIYNCEEIRYSNALVSFSMTINSFTNAYKAHMYIMDKDDFTQPAADNSWLVPNGFYILGDANTADDIVLIFNQAATNDTGSARTVYIKTNLYAKLTAEQRAILTGKNYTLTQF